MGHQGHCRWHLSTPTPSHNFLLHTPDYYPSHLSSRGPSPPYSRSLYDIAAGIPLPLSEDGGAFFFSSASGVLGKDFFSRISSALISLFLMVSAFRFYLVSFWLAIWREATDGTGGHGHTLAFCALSLQFRGRDLRGFPRGWFDRTGLILLHGRGIFETSRLGRAPWLGWCGAVGGWDTSV